VKPYYSYARQGAALIIVLAFLVILSGIVVTYLARSSTDRQLAHGTFNETRADVFARSALDVVVGSLKQEILNGSTNPAPTFGSPPTVFTLYKPTLDNYIAPLPDGTPADKSIPNLTKRSVASVPANPAVDSRASGVSSTAVSLNGRSVSPARWNKHYLIPRTTTPTGDNDTTPTASFVAPDWVLLTRNGPAAKTWSTTLGDSTPGNSNYVIGRYAYAIYDEGGILDFNVAGYPLPATPPTNYASTVGRKGLPSFADISTTGLSSTAINDVIGFRSFATVQPTGTFGGFTLDTPQTNRFLTAVFGETNGFMNVSGTVWNNGTDQAFIGRQELINYRSPSVINFSVGALQSLGTFSRSVTTPSWSPDYDAADRGGAGFSYKTNAGTNSSINRDLNKVRVGAPFTRFDSTPAVVGDYLIKRRFPLSRLAWITYKGPSADVYSANSNDPAILSLLSVGVTVPIIQAGTAANIKAAFGLVWDSRSYGQPGGTSAGTGLQWVYTSPTTGSSGGTFNGTSGTGASAIKILQTVEGENREPDFFELMQAVILSGSLGQNTGGGTAKTSGGPAEVPPVFPDVHMSNKTQHLLSIGAAAIDQADPDSFPTRIRFDKSLTDSWLALGVENLPYITEMCPVGGVSSDNAAKWASYALFQLWNPNESPLPTQPQVRLRVDGGIGVFNGNGQTWNTGSTALHVASGASVLVSNNAAFSPTAAPITSANVSASGSSAGTFVSVPAYAASTKYVGFRLPDFTMPAGTASQKPELWWQVGATGGSTPNPFNASLEVNLNGTYVPYNYFVGLNATNSWISNAPIFVRAANAAAGTPVAFTASPDSAARVPYCFMKADPRATRFGIFQVNTNTSTTPGSHARIDVPIWEKSNSKYKSGWGGSIGSDVEHVPLLFNGTKPYLPATLCINTDASSNSTTGYVDPDGVRRFADAGYQPNSGNNNSSTPYDDTQLQYQAVVLNRPFRNVGELGYTFRDLPWKSLDFFTSSSADAGLLDVFSVNDDPLLVAGRVNLNTRQAPVIQAVIQKALWDEYDATNLISLNGASGFSHSDTMSQNYANYIVQNSNLLNRSGLATSLSGSTEITTKVLKPGNGVGHENEGAKTRREAVARSIASCGQTRTWNLMIDVIAQSGRYPTTATALANFVVEGEKRYWLHIAIDRFTGEVIDQQLEAVYE
jgi:hypothetical protein